MATLAPRLSRSELAEIKTAAETGLPLIEVARRFGIEHERVRKLAQRGGWLTAAKVDKAIVKQMSLNVPKGQKAAQIVAQTLTERQNHLKEQVHRITKGLLNGAENDLDDGKMRIEGVRDLETVVKMTRLNLEMTTGDAAPAVQVLFAGQSSLREEVVDLPAEDADALELDEEDAKNSVDLEE